MKKIDFIVTGTVITSFLSTLCCLPALLFLCFGVSSGALSFFTTLEYIGIPLFILTILFVILSIYNFRKKISCSCGKKEKIFQYIFFVAFFIFIIFLLFYHEFIPLFVDYLMNILFLFLIFTSLIFASNISVFKVEGMHWPLCATAVKKAIKKIDGVEKESEY